MPPTRASLPHYLSADELLKFEADINNALTSPGEVIRQSPHTRNPAHVWKAIDDVQDVIDLLSRYRTAIPVRTWNSLRVEVALVKEPLDTIVEQQHLHPPLDIALGQPARDWVPGPNGRKVIDIDKDLLQTFEKYRFSDTELMERFNCCRKTIYNRRQELGVAKRGYTDISPDDLAEEIIRILNERPENIGLSTLNGALVSRGVVQPRARVNALLRAIWPTEARGDWRRTARRRVYKVPFPNSLWHVDGHHKLIDVKIVIHGAIDGYSRCITYMKASDNNRSATVGELFKDAVSRWGWPARVRADHGMENMEIKALMEEARCSVQRPFIQGPSVRNTRIERLWVDIQPECTNSFRKAFDDLIDAGLLDVDNGLDLYCLHLCYLPMLNRALHEFVVGHNAHGIRTAGYQRPEELWLRGRIAASGVGIDIMRQPAGLREGANQDQDLPDRQRLEYWEVDDFGTREEEAQEDDPHVDCPSVLRFVDPEYHEILLNEEVRAHLLEVAGPAWPPGEDWGKGRYSAVCDELLIIIRAWFA